MTAGEATVVIVGAGYPGKRHIYEHLAELGARLVMVDEAHHWSERLVIEGVAAHWIAVPITGDADVDAATVLDALSAQAIRPDGVLTFWELRVPVVARVATSLGLPGNPIAAVDTQRCRSPTCYRTPTWASSSTSRLRWGKK